MDRNFLFKKRFLVKKVGQKDVWSKDILVWKIFRYQKFEGPKSLVKMGSYCLDIAAWTNVIRANVSWTNVTLTFGIR